MRKICRLEHKSVYPALPSLENNEEIRNLRNDCEETDETTVAKDTNERNTSDNNDGWCKEITIHENNYGDARLGDRESLDTLTLHSSRKECNKNHYNALGNKGDACDYNDGNDGNIGVSEIHDVNDGDHYSLTESEPTPSGTTNWLWPAIDTLTDDSIASFMLPTCSELGSQRIRLIKIRPGNPDDTIRCDARCCLLSQAGEYTSLSYTWGCPTTRCQIMLDDQPILVTVNLWRFLWQARELQTQFSGQIFRWLWIDALSIQQSDPWEKLEQVKIISKIFENAKQAVVWLGPAYGDSDRAMRLLSTRKEGQSHWKALRGLYSTPTGPAVLELCERPYWRRLWVYQELKTSRYINLLCGNKRAGFDAFSDLLLYKGADGRAQAIIRRTQDSPAAAMVRLIHTSTGTSLWSTLEGTRHLGCTDPRDKVYAVLNVVGSGHNDIEADYTTTVLDLANRVLHNMHHIESPRSLAEVAEQCTFLETVFSMQSNTIYGIENKAFRTCTEPLLQLHRLDVEINNQRTLELVFKDVFAWCKRYNHVSIARLVWGEGFENFADRDLGSEQLRAQLPSDHLSLNWKKEMIRWTSPEIIRWFS